MNVTKLILNAVYSRGVSKKKKPKTRMPFNILLSCSALIILAVPSSMSMTFVEKYLFSDWEFSIYLAILVTVDTITGMMYAIKNKSFNSHRMGDLIFKIILYPLALVTINALTTHKVNGEANFIIQYIAPYFNSSACAFLMLREVLSISENMGKLGFRLLPKFVMKHFTEFDEEGKFVPTSKTKDK